MCISWRIVGNVFIQRYKRVFINVTFLLYVLKIFERFLISIEVVRGGMTEQKRLGNGGTSSDGLTGDVDHSD